MTLGHKEYMDIRNLAKISAVSVFSGMVLMPSLCGCSEEATRIRGGIGLVQPQITVDASVTLNTGQVSKVLVSPVPAPADVSFRVSSESGEYGHTWDRFSSYDVNMPYEPGVYMLEAFSGNKDKEGFESPYFYASSKVNVVPSEVVAPELECKLASTMFLVEYTDMFRNIFSEYSAIIHSSGGGYISYPAEEVRPVYLRAGNLTFDMSVTVGSGESVAFEAATVANARSAHLYHVTVDASLREADNVPVIVMSFDESIVTDDITIALTPEFIAQKAPTLTTYGFISGSPVRITEGVGSDNKLAVNAAGAPMSKIMLTTSSDYLLQQGWPEEVDVLHLDLEDKILLEQYGLLINQKDSGDVEIDFSGVAKNLRLTGSDVQNSQFTLVATGTNHKISDAVTLSLDVAPADVALIEAADVIVGEDSGVLLISSSVAPDGNISVYTSSVPEDGWHQAQILSIAPAGNQGEYSVVYALPASTDPFTLRLDYCGSEIARVIKRPLSPDYSIMVNAFALKANVTIVVPDDATRRLVTSRLHVYANGERVPVIDRDEDAGTIVVTGLQPDTRYEFKGSIFEFPASGDFCAPVIAATEKCLNLENGTFDDVKETIKYGNLNSGGRYSQSVVPIYNGQNRVSYRLSTPKGWATTNDKTFCMSAKNHNTWYMQPSVYTDADSYSGYAVKIQSTAWDVDGPEIKPYLQESQPYTTYSKVMPEIAHKAAGKLFLGDYSFDSSTGVETYREGISFSSRPSALNGFYRYIPCTLMPYDRGYALVEVVGVENGQEITIGRGEMELIPVTGYTAFSVPVEYMRPDVKATKLKITMASTSRVGDIRYEDSMVVTVPDLKSATSLGSALWVDELSLSY